MPDMRCVWVEAWERSGRMPAYGHEIHRLVAPLNQRLQGSSAWINEFTGTAQAAPAGWVAWLEDKPGGGARSA
jgi:hypothetical protein